MQYKQHSHMPTCAEVAIAAWKDEKIRVHPSHDVWALGVIAFEAITNERALKGQSNVVACAHGAQPYPWELPWEQQPVRWRNSRLNKLVMPALARDPAARASAEDLYAAVSRVGQATTSSGARESSGTAM